MATKVEPTDLYLTTMANGDVWAVPIMAIARSRAEHYKDEYDGSLERSLAEDTLPCFTEDAYEVTDWAANNMNWSDAESQAFLYRKAGVAVEDWEESWTNGDHDIVKGS